MIDWDKQFTVTSISRRDIKDAGISQAVVADLTDSDMERIASRLDDTLRGDDFHDTLYMATVMSLEWDSPKQQEGV